MADVDLTFLTPAQGFRIIGDEAYDQAGFSVSNAGDVNGDGINDLIVGAPYNDAGGDFAGAAYVVYGRSGNSSNLDLTNLTVADGFRILGDAAFDRAGSSVSNAGDINGDGIDDLIVGATGNDAGGIDAGAAYVVYGRSGGLSDLDLTTLTTAQGFRIIGDAAGDVAGTSVSGAGDVNGDGLEDLIVGAPFNDAGSTNAGAAYVVYGRSGGRSDLDLTTRNGADGFRILGELTDQAGTSVSNAGDVNGDGLEDLIVGATGNGFGGGFRAGAAYVVYGRSGFRGTLDFSTLPVADGFLIFGDAARDYTGTSVSTAGDVNGDGIDDLIVGANFNDAGGTNSGAVYVVYGRSGGRSTLDLTALTAADGFRIIGDVANDRAGRSVSSAGDVNGDGFDDLIVGADGNDAGGSYAGAAYVVYGRLGGLGDINLSNFTAALGFRIIGDAANDYAGTSVSAAGDVNGDGIDDLIVGAPRGDDGGGIDAGAAYVIYGTNAAPVITANGGGESAAINVVENLTSVTTVVTNEARPTYSIAGGADAARFVIDAATGALSFRSAPNFEALGDVDRDNVYQVVVRATDAGGLFDEQLLSVTVLDLIETGSDGNDTLTGSAGDDTLSGLNGNDTLIGGAGNDALFGGNRNDTLFGGTGNDSLFGQESNDILVGGLGSDVLNGGSGLNDTADYRFLDFGVLDTAGLTASLRDPNANTGAAQGDTYIDVENLSGTDLRDILIGDSGANSLFGNGGDDRLEGWEGNDFLYGGDGNDQLLGGNNTDLLDGGNGNDILGGGASNDTLTGGAGNDSLDGGTGRDTASFAGDLANFDIAQVGTSIVVTDLTGTEGVDTVSNVEQFAFAGVVYSVNSLVGPATISGLVYEFGQSHQIA